MSETGFASSKYVLVRSCKSRTIAEPTKWGSNKQRNSADKEGWMVWMGLDGKF